MNCDVGKMNVYDKIVIKNQKNGKNSKSKNFFLHKSPSIEVVVGTEFTACQGKLIPDGTQTKFTIYHMYATHIANSRVMHSY